MACCCCNKPEVTFAIIKPDAVAAKNAGKIIDMIEAAGFTIRGMRKIVMTKALAEQFYAVHKARPFFNELVEFMTSGPAIVLALSKPDAVQAWRDLMGPTDSKKAPKGTVRGEFGTDVGKNAVHGSDSPETAAYELTLFFPELM
jgi:nucleoside-diphosphate kinase